MLIVFVRHKNKLSGLDKVPPTHWGSVIKHHSIITVVPVCSYICPKLQEEDGTILLS